MNNSSGTRLKAKPKARKRYLGSASPPRFISTPQLRHVFRFTASTAGTYTITKGNLLNLLQVATGASASTRLIYALKLGSVECWAPTNSSFSSQTVAVEWNGSEYSPSSILSDTSMNLRPAHVFGKPPKNSSISLWISTLSDGAIPFFSITVPQYAVIDVRVTCMLYDDETPTAGDSPSMATTGKLYYNYLDGRTSGKLVPTGGVSIIP